MTAVLGPCGWCGVMTTSITATCWSCRSIELRRWHQPDVNDALRGGRWVSVRGVQKWEVDWSDMEPEVAPEPEPEPEPSPRDRIACPTCEVTAAEGCRARKTGLRVKDHPTRTIPRMCRACEEPARYRSLYCAECARAAEAAWRQAYRDRRGSAA